MFSEISNGFVVKHLLDGMGRTGCGLVHNGSGMAYGAYVVAEVTCPECLYFLQHGQQLNYQEPKNA